MPSAVTLLNQIPVVTDDSGAPLPCYGCAYAEPCPGFPGSPSLTAACLVCVRNPQQAEFHERKAKNFLMPHTDIGTDVGEFPILVYPMDAYVSIHTLALFNSVVAQVRDRTFYLEKRDKGRP